ncbi:hypothetical protein [Streptomyces sp. NPDC046909]|uniref:hypothetical protein n=1 Tax=Streptomyces sp. NPDC046909 TaxID=3155617 RepID=UPI0033EA85F3
MPFINDSTPHAIGLVTTLHPDGQVDDFVSAPARAVRLTDLPALAGTTPYTTLPLADGIELHHLPAHPGTENPVASRLAAHYGYEGFTLRGPICFTGDSAETDEAAGVGLDVLDDLHAALRTAAEAADIRLYCKFRLTDTVTVADDDYVPGDLFWFCGQSHRVFRFEDMEPDSATARRWPGARVLVCDDGFEITSLPGAVRPERADRAPAGFWQRTGHQLLPASR